jgi:hypothetical protein
MLFVQVLRGLTLIYFLIQNFQKPVSRDILRASELMEGLEGSLRPSQEAVNFRTSFPHRDGSYFSVMSTA